MFKEGEEIEVTGVAAKDGTPHMWSNGVTIVSTGVKFTMGSRPPNERILGRTAVLVRAADRSPRHDSAHTRLVLQPDLDRIVAASRGDAITKLKLQAIDYDVGSHRHAAGWKQFGWLFGIAGLLGVTAGVARGGDNGTVTAEVSAGIAGFGVALYLLGASLQTPTSWQLEVSGQVVRRATPTPAPAPPSAAPAL